MLNSCHATFRFDHMHFPIAMQRVRVLLELSIDTASRATGGR